MQGEGGCKLLLASRPRPNGPFRCARAPGAACTVRWFVVDSPLEQRDSPDAPDRCGNWPSATASPVAMSGASSTLPFSAPNWSRRSCKAGNRSSSLPLVLPNSICRSTGPTSAAFWRAEERPSIECVQARAWALLVERFVISQGGTASTPVREKQLRRAASWPLRPVLWSRPGSQPRESRAFAPAAMEGTCETDSPAEQRRFELLVP